MSRFGSSARRTERVAALAWVVVCLALCACDDELTEILVVVETDLAVPDAIDTIVVRTVGPSGQGRDVTAPLRGGAALPVTVALVPAGGALGPMEVRAEGRLGDVLVVDRRVRTRFLEGDVRVLVLRLERACDETACTGETTCSAGDCVAIDVAPETLPRWSGSLPSPRDGGTPDDDAGPDAGHDGGPPSNAPRLLLEGAVPATATYAFWMEVREGAQPESLTDLFESQVGPPENEEHHPYDVQPRLSPDGRWLVVRTDRDPRCPFGCIMLFETAHLDAPEIVRIGTDTLSSYFPAVTNDGDAIVGKDSLGLLSITRRREDGDGWTVPQQIGATDHTEAQWIVVSPDGTRALYDCVQPGGHQAICEVGLDGEGFRVVVKDTDAPFGDESTDAYTTRGDYEPDGSIVFEANWMGNQLWRASDTGDITRVHDGFFTEYFAPCVLPDGRIVAYDGEGEDDIVVLSADGEALFHLPLPAMPVDRDDWYPGPLGC